MLPCELTEDRKEISGLQKLTGGPNINSISYMKIH